MTAAVDATDLQPILERLLTDALHRPVSVRALRREVSEFATCSSAEVVQLTLADRQRLSLFLKHLGDEEADHPDKQFRGRELRIYQQLFDDPRLPVPRSFGSSWNEQTKRGLLLLQYVPDWNLQYHDLSYWFEAARRLAHLHLHFAERASELKSADFLLRLDETYFRRWAGRARDAVSRRSGDLAAKLDHIIARYDLVADLTRQMPTLVHNDLAPKNVLADRSTSPAGIFFVDWEMAGVGCGLLDLAHLNHGLEPADERKMIDAYCGELRGSGLVPARSDALSTLLAACKLHQTIYRLAHIDHWKIATPTAAKWVAEADSFLAQELLR